MWMIAVSIRRISLGPLGLRVAVAVEQGPRLAMPVLVKSLSLTQSTQIPARRQLKSEKPGSCKRVHQRQAPPGSRAASSARTTRCDRDNVEIKRSFQHRGSSFAQQYSSQLERFMATLVRAGLQAIRCWCESQNPSHQLRAGQGRRTRGRCNQRRSLQPAIHDSHGNRFLGNSLSGVGEICRTKRAATKPACWRSFGKITGHMAQQPQHQKAKTIASTAAAKAAQFIIKSDPKPGFRVVERRAQVQVLSKVPGVDRVPWPAPGTAQTRSHALRETTG